MLRLRRLCSKEEVFLSRSHELSKHFLNRGYKKPIIKKAIERASKICRPETLQYTKRNKHDRIPFVITHNPRNAPLRQILKDKHNTTICFYKL